MRRPSPFLIIFILFVTLFSFLINIPSSITLPFSLPFLPANQEIALINLNTLLRPLQLEREVSFRRGLDLEGGTSITLRAEVKNLPSTQRADALESAKEVIERRINFFGVSEPTIQTSQVNNDSRIIVEIPGVTDVNQAVRLIGQTAQLSFWEEGDASASGNIASQSAFPLGVAEILGPGATQTELTGKDLKSAAVTFNPSTGAPQVQLTFTPDGGKKFGDITRRNIGKIVGIVLDDQLIQAPRVNEAILSGSAEITGEYTLEQAKAIQIQLNAGALPVPLTVLEQRAIGASLGNEAVQKSLVAGLLGFIVIVIFMISLYGRRGVIASLALIVYTLITLAVFRLIPVTMTLAGIAGFILSLGIAVDANILIFERIREEVRRGRPASIAVQVGFSRAWSSIRDSNVASLITSGVLLYFGTSTVRGFALTLAIGVIISMFSAITVTRTLLQIVEKDK